MLGMAPTPTPTPTPPAPRPTPPVGAPPTVNIVTPPTPPAPTPPPTPPDLYFEKWQHLEGTVDNIGASSDMFIGFIYGWKISTYEKDATGRPYKRIKIETYYEFDMMDRDHRFLQKATRDAYQRSLDLAIKKYNPKNINFKGNWSDMGKKQLESQNLQ
jgi:hypothetical protein